MAVPDPPFSTPRIMKVLEPSAGQYEVIVRMDPTMASKFPDKPFGTAISAIGLAVKDSDKYPGYTLVSIEPADKGGKDHYWIFQKLGGPEWTTKSVGQDGSVPPRYKRMIATTRTKQEVASGTELDALSGNLVASLVEQQDNTGKAVKVNTEEVLTLDTSSVDESVERKPFVSIKSTMTPGATPVIPGTGNGSARLVYENGATKIYENVAEVATARPGPAGTEKDEKPFVRISTSKRYSTDNSIATATGIANIVFNDGVVQVYEISEPTATPKPYALLAGKDAKLGYRIEETDVYATDATLATKTGNVGVAYDDGNVRVYKKTEVRAFLNNTEFDSEVKNTKLFKETTHSKFQITATGDDTKDWGGTMVYSDGDLTVFRIDEVSIATKVPITYYSVVNAQVPSVLSSILIEPIEMLPNSNGAVRDKVCVRAIIEEGYSGLFKAKITEKYTENPSEADSFTPLIFKPTAIHYDGLNFGVSIGETLHGSITLVDSIGSEDPDYAPLQELSSDFRTFNATAPAVVPTGWQPHAIQVEPYKNGYLVKEIYIQYKP